MNIATNFPNLSGLLKRLWPSASSVEIIPPEAEAAHNQEKQDITDLMSRIGDFAKNMQEDHPFIDNVTTMQNGYIGVIMSNPEKTASQIIAYNVDEDKNGNPVVSKKTTRIIKADEDNFPEQNEVEILRAPQAGGDDYVEALSQIIMEDVSETLGVDEVALTAAVQGDVIVEGEFKTTPEALTAE